MPNNVKTLNLKENLNELKTSLNALKQSKPVQPKKSIKTIITLFLKVLKQLLLHETTENEFNPYLEFEEIISNFIDINCRFHANSTTIQASTRQRDTGLICKKNINRIFQHYNLKKSRNNSDFSTFQIFLITLFTRIISELSFNSPLPRRRSSTQRAPTFSEIQ